MEWFDIIALAAFLLICAMVYLAGKAIARLRRNPIRERLAAASADPDGSLAVLADEDVGLDHVTPDIREADSRFEKLDVELSQAIPSYSPRSLERYLRKFECFCFTKQVLQPNEVRQMPVQFIIESSIPADINTVTISYTFFELPDGKKAINEK